MKNIKIILIILNIIFGFIIYYSINNDDLDVYKLQQDITDLSNVHKLDILSNDNQISISKKNHNWIISSPLTWDADNYSISNFQTIFAHLRFTEIFSVNELAERGEIIDDYGITKKSPSIILYTQKNKRTITLGKKTRDLMNVYCMVENSNTETNKIWRVSEEIINLIKTPFKDWADTRLIKCGLYQIDNITASFKSNNNSTTTTKLIKRKNEWFFDEPFKAKANNDQVRFLINNILSEQIMEFAERTDDNSTFIDIEKNWVLHFIINESTGKQEFKVSETFKDNSIPFRLCKSSYSSHLLKIEDKFLTNFSNWSTRLRERNIFQIDTKKIFKLKIVNKYNNFELIKSDINNWIIKTEDGKNLIGDFEKISSLIQNLNGIEIKEFLSFNPTQNELKSINNFENNYVIKVQNTDTSINTILISKNKLNASLWKVLRVEDSLLCLVDEELNDILELMVFHLKDRNIINNEIIEGLTIIDQDSNRTIQKTFNDSKSTILNHFRKLRVKSFLNDQGKDDGTWNNGDWVPWRYKLIFNRDNNSSLNHSFSILTSDILKTNELIGKFQENNVTFNLPVKLINQLLLLKKEFNDIQN